MAHIKKKKKKTKKNRYGEAGKKTPPHLKRFCKCESNDPMAEAEVCPRRT